MVRRGQGRNSQEGSKKKKDFDHKLINSFFLGRGKQKGHSRQMTILSDLGVEMSPVDIGQGGRNRIQSDRM